MLGFYCSLSVSSELLYSIIIFSGNITPTPGRKTSKHGRLDGRLDASLLFWKILVNTAPICLIPGQRERSSPISFPYGLFILSPATDPFSASFCVCRFWVPERTIYNSSK